MTPEGSFGRWLAWPLVLGGLAVACGTPSDLSVTQASSGGSHTIGTGGTTGTGATVSVTGGTPAATGGTATTGGAGIGGRGSGGIASGGKATGGIGTGGGATGGAGGAGSCLPRDDDPTGYLVKICRYLLAHTDTIRVLVDPNSYHIVNIERRSEADRNVLWVYLDCCFTGDIAVIDQATGAVIGFSVGDM